jgi:8-oxo-dGTP diphosphatase
VRDEAPPRAPDGYDPDAFPRVAVTVDVVVLTLQQRRLHALLVERAAEPWQGIWALPGGFVRPDETLEEAAARELREETGVDASAHLEQLRTYGDPGRDPRMRVVTVCYLAVLPEIGAVTAGTDAARAELVAVDALLGPKPARRLAFDHDLILADAVAHAREKLSTTSLATAFVGPEFTLGDLREVYEAAWGVELDPANFRRKVLATEGFVMATGRRAVSGPEGGKPAETYRPVGRARLHPPLLLRASDDEAVQTQGHRGPRKLDPDRDRATVWRFWLGDDAAFQRTVIDAGLLAPVARGETPISDEEWNAFMAGMQQGDLVIVTLARERVAIGEVTSGVRERPNARDRRLRRVREMKWWPAIPRSRLPVDMRERLDGSGVLGPLRVSAAARRLRHLLGE